MKKSIIIAVLFSFIAFSTFAQKKAYKKGMTKAFALWESEKTDEAVAMFERIGQAEKKEWLPLYYVSNVLITSSFQVKDEKKRSLMLDKAKDAIKEAHKRSNDNPEILTLEGLLYTSYVAMNPRMYAMQYSPEIMNLHDKALKIEPSNPRANLNVVEFEMNTAKFFKQDMKPFCERMSQVVTLFENYENNTAFAPEYGKDRAEKVANSCTE